MYQIYSKKFRKIVSLMRDGKYDVTQKPDEAYHVISYLENRDKVRLAYYIIIMVIFMAFLTSGLSFLGRQEALGIGLIFTAIISLYIFISHFAQIKQVPESYIDWYKNERKKRHGKEETVKLLNEPIKGPADVILDTLNPNHKIEQPSNNPVDEMPKKNIVTEEGYLSFHKDLNHQYEPLDTKDGEEPPRDK